MLEHGDGDGFDSRMARAFFSIRSICNGAFIVGGFLTAALSVTAGADVSGNLAGAVALAAQTITFVAPIDRVFSAGPFALDATADSGLPVTFSVVSGPATINGNTLTPSGPGSVVIRAAQVGNATYAAAANVDRTLNFYNFGRGTRGDFNRDGMSDILWSNTVTGDRALWLMNVDTIGTNAFVGTVPIDWSVSAATYFDGDASIFWTNTVTGERVRWRMLRASLMGTNYLGAIPLPWKISGTGDIGGDVVWTNDVTGERAMWTWDGWRDSLGIVPLEWIISGTGDFDGDGNTDILLSNTATGDQAIWFMWKTAIVRNAFVGTVPVQWKVSAVGDFDADRKTDIFWTNTVTGDRAVWLMNGSVASDSNYMGTVPVEWEVSTTGDFNGDWRTDLLWTNTLTGERALWFMHALTKIGGASLGVVPLAWVPAK